mgnify:FL=1
MKIYIMTDMEGVCGVNDHDNWVHNESKNYKLGTELTTLEVNAAIAGFYEAGAAEIAVIDGHGFGGIDRDILDSRAVYVRESGYPFALDSTFDGIAWIGQHAKAGSEYAHIAHTGWFNIKDYRINGLSLGEFGLMAVCAAYIGVPSIFVSGDRALCKEAKGLVSRIVTAEVKRGLLAGSGDELDCEEYRGRNLLMENLSYDEARKRIYEGAKTSLKQLIDEPASFILPLIDAPYKREIHYRMCRGCAPGKAFGCDKGKEIPEHIVISEHENDLIELLNMPSQ